jgi:hypothetical protein
MAAGGQVRNAKSQKPTSVQSNSGGATVKNVSRSDRPSDVGLIQRSVRIVVDDAKSRSFGTGTVIRSVPGETIVLTCAHLFQGVSRQAKTTVEFFGAPDRPKLGGEVLARDQQADVCLVRVVSPQPFPTAQVAGKQAALSNGQPTASVGCDNGADPTVRHMRVTAINRYVGPPTIECSGEPVEGRSGGGLFNESGDVVGVCSARDPADHRGIYSGLAAIHTLLDRNRLNGLYEPNTSAIAVAGYDSNKPVPPVTLPAPNAIGLKVDRDLAVPDEADRAEVVCVIRSLDDPNAPPRVVLLNRATPEFLSVLEKETANQAARPATSMRLPNKPHVTPAGSAAEPATTPATTDLSGWRSAQAGRDRSSKSTSQGTQSAVEESASWQKNWPAGSSSSDGPVHR